MTATSLSKKQERTILIIDDELASLRVVVDNLEHQNFRVVVARDGKEGLRRAQLVQPALVLLDVLMPGMNGFETCRSLKALESTKDIPVIFMTVLTDTVDKVAGFAAGGVDYVTKPFQIEEVVARVKVHLSLHEMQRQLAVQNAELERQILGGQRVQ
jgi:DNA-binding response OmpR family regulator